MNNLKLPMNKRNLIFSNYDLKFSHVSVKDNHGR